MYVDIRADRDARPGEEFSFVIYPKDIGDRKDPERCVFARCAKTHMRTDLAWFGSAVAYLALPKKRGEGLEIVRFVYPAATKRAIRKFDVTGEIEPGTFKIVAPKGLRQAGARRIPNKEYQERKKRRERGRSKKTYIWHAPRGWGRAA